MSSSEALQLIASKRKTRGDGTLRSSLGGAPKVAKTKTAAVKSNGSKPAAAPKAGKAAAAAKPIRRLLGNSKDGVRAHPSYDHPGDFYAVEASTRRRVFSGYHSVEEIKAWCKQQGVGFLGVVNVTGVGSGSGYNKSSVEKAVKAHGATQRKTPVAVAKTATKNGKATAKPKAAPTAKPKATPAPAQPVAAPVEAATATA